jgi:hypothetical protein
VKIFAMMAALCVVVMTVDTRASDAPRLERRCGWISNPTPGNWDFIDKDGDWTISDQGGGDSVLDGLPEDRPDGKRWWVKTQDSGYGYGCMCLNVQVDKKDKKVVKIDGGKSLPIVKCRQDRATKKLEPRVR